MKNLECILGGHFETIIDHKPFVHLFNNAQSRITLRIERWSLHLQEFDFTISQIKGIVNPADFLARHLFDINIRLTDNIIEQYVNFIQNHACSEQVVINRPPYDTFYWEKVKPQTPLP